MNPDTNRFEELELKKAFGAMKAAEKSPLFPAMQKPAQLLRPDGSPVPEHWSKFCVGELVDIKGYRFKVAHIGESYLVLEPHGPIIIGESDR